MKKYIVQLMMLFFIVHVHAMQNELCENTKEFIQRTKRYEDIPLSDFLVLSHDRKRGAVINFYENYDRQPYLKVFSKYNDKKIKILELPLPAGWQCITTMDFNMQRTLFLVRGIYYDDEGKQRRKRMIIPLHVAEYYWKKVAKRRRK